MAVIARLGNPVAPACGLIALEPTVECDSYITLGRHCRPVLEIGPHGPHWLSTCRPGSKRPRPDLAPR